MDSVISKKITYFLLIILTVQLVASDSEVLDTTKIGVQEGQQYDGYIVFVHINETGVRGVFGQNLEDVSIGDRTNSKTITKLDNETGDITIYNTNYGLAGWEGDYNLQNFCSEVVYTDWDYWRNKHTKLLGDPIISIQLFETDEYYGYMSEGNGYQIDADGVKTTTGHRQDCIYNKKSGFREFFGLYQEIYFPNITEVTYTVEQFLLSSNLQRETNASLYSELISMINPDISGNSIIAPEDITDEVSPTLKLDYPVLISITTFFTTILLIKNKKKNNITIFR